MTEVEAVWAEIDARVNVLPGERRPLSDSVGFTLAEAVRADRDAPPFDRATMDGYAVWADETARELTVVGMVRPGEDPGGRVCERGQALRIFTGAPVPARGMRVVMQEDVRVHGATLRIERNTPGRNVAERGEDFCAGAVLLPAGARVDAAAVAVLASVGCAEPMVHRAPRVRHFTTGDEVIPFADVPDAGCIRNANAPLIAALLRTFPGVIPEHRHLPDDEAAAWRIVSDADRSTPDLWLFSGGASVGDFDFTARLLERLGFTIWVSCVNVRPGKPLIFATRGEQVAFGLPGNPLSHFVCFHLFVHRALTLLTGGTPRGLEAAELAVAIPGRPNPRVTFWPGRYAFRGALRTVVPVPWNSSGHLGNLPGVDALVRLEANAELPKPGAIVETLACPPP